LRLACNGSESLVSDIFREVDEEVRREHLRKLWDKWGNYLVALGFVVVLGIAGWRGWEWWQARRAAEAGVAFEAALSLSDGGKLDEAEAAWAKIAAESPAGYQLLARFREAAELARRDRDAAVKAYDTLAGDSNIRPVLRELAAVRAGMILVDTAPLNELAARLEPLTGPDHPFRHTAREMMALAAWRTGDNTAVRRWLDLITNDAETPASMRTRVDVLLALVGSERKG
jgi:hypothetical protein